MLTKKQRDVIEFVVMQGYPENEIAVSMRISQQSVHKIKERALNTMREKMGDDYIKTVEKDYKEMFIQIHKAAKNNGTEALIQLIEMLTPLIRKCSRSPVTNKYNKELNGELISELCEAIARFKIQGGL